MKTDFFSGGGELGAAMRAYDWSSTPLGSPDNWPQSLRTSIRILLTTQHPMFIWWGAELIQFYNDAYSKTMGPERHPSALGQPGRECWQEIWDAIGPQIDLVMSGQGATWHEEQLIPVTRNGRREDVWWTYSFSPIDDDNARNGVGGVLVVCNDVTDRHRAYEALATSDERLALALSAGVVGTWDWHIPEDKVFADERFARFYGVDFEQAKHGAPIALFVASIHPDDQALVSEKIEGAICSGGEYAAEYRLVQADGSTRWLAAQGHCLYDSEGKPTRFPGAVFEITDRKLAEQHRELLAQELNHRLKNNLATVQAIVHQTLKGQQSLPVARADLLARLLALSRAQDILTGESWAGADVHDVVSTAVEPHAGGASRFNLQGPSLRISPRAAMALALTLHELATNAVKHGALSASDGHIAVTWQTSHMKSGDVFHLHWKESNGPPVVRPARRGFVSQLIEGALLSEVGAEAKMSYEPEGVVWELVAPVARIGG